MKKILMETLIIGSVLGSKPVVQKPKSIENSQNESLRDQVEVVVNMQDPKELIDEILEKVLNEAVVFEEDKHLEFLLYLMDCIRDYDSLNINRFLERSTCNKIKEIIIDFLFRFKDKHPFCNSENKGPMDQTFKI